VPDSVNDTFECPELPGHARLSYWTCLRRQAAERAHEETYPECTVECQRGREVRARFPEEAEAARDGERPYGWQEGAPEEPSSEPFPTYYRNEPRREVPEDKGGEETVKKRRCRECGNWFEPDHGRRVNCPKCRTEPREKSPPEETVEPPPAPSPEARAEQVRLEASVPSHLTEARARALLGQLLHCQEELDGLIAGILETGVYDTRTLYGIRRRLGLVVRDDLVPQEATKLEGAAS
jgi:ribosomal protein S27AE